MFFDPVYFLYLAPALLLGLWAQFRVKATYAMAMRMPARLSGAAAARHILDSAGAEGVNIESTPGHLSDHYDPRHRVLRLSAEVYQSRSIAAVGIAAHEAGHAIQHARHYAPLVIRNLAVPAASFGSSISMTLIFLGVLLSLNQVLIWAGIAAFGAVAFFQLVNLPVEFDASRRAKRELVALGIVPDGEMRYVNKMLNAAAWTYVAATLQTLLTLLYYILRFTTVGRRSDD
jgi:uncharacterized protein